MAAKKDKAMSTYEIGDYSGMRSGGGEISLFAKQPIYEAETHMQAVKMYLKDKGVDKKIKRSGEYGANQFVATKVVVQGDRVYMDYRKGACKCWYEFAN